MSNHFTEGGEAAGVPDLRGFAGGMLATNGYAFRARDGWVLVDAPEGALRWLEDEGIEPGLLLLTHQHFDHILGAAEVAGRFGCPIWAFSEFDGGLTLESSFGGLAGTGFEIVPFEVARRLGETGPDGAALDVLGTPVEVLHVPGHSPDSLCFVLPDAALVFGGDVLFQQGVGRTDFPGGDSGLLLAGIRDKLLPLGDAFAVLPGHGPPTTIGDERVGNPFLAER